MNAFLLFSVKSPSPVGHVAGGQEGEGAGAAAPLTLGTTGSARPAAPCTALPGMGLIQTSPGPLTGPSAASGSRDREVVEGCALAWSFQRLFKPNARHAPPTSIAGPPTQPFAQQPAPAACERPH